MATEQYFEVANDPLNGDGKDSLENLENSLSFEDGPSAGFDCNICLDSVQDPVVTLCGHLYCWPCIYKWLCFQTISTENLDQKHQQCPVCKADVSHGTLIPLYGRGVTTKASTGSTPKRPLGPCGLGRIRRLNTTESLQFQQPFDPLGYSYQPQMYYTQRDSYPDSSMLSSGGMSISVPDPVIQMLGEMVHTRVFGNTMSTDLYTHPNSYNLAGSNNRRIRRQLMQADKSLSRISFFLCCCIFFCLLLF